MSQRSSRWVHDGVVIIGILCCAGIARADEPPSAQMFTFAPVNYPIAISDEHRWSVEMLSTAIGDVSNHHLVMGGLTAGVGYYLFQNISIQFDVSGYGFNEGRSSGAATGITLGIRHRIVQLRKTSLFIDCSGGEIQASNNIPVGGTHLNNTIEVGLGASTPIADHLSLLAGVRFFHLSNARSEGAERNPSMNGLQGVLGVEWRF